MIREFEVGRCTVTIDFDSDPENPREVGENYGTMVCWHRRYNLGDEQPKEDAGEYLLELARKVIKAGYPESLLLNNRNTILAKHYTFVPLAMIDHSGLSFYVGGTVIGEASGHPQGHASSDSAGWDSGQVGFVYVSLTKALEWCQVKDIKQGWDTQVAWEDEKGKRQVSLREFARLMLEGEIDTYDDFQTGQIYEYRISHPGDSCAAASGGWYDEDECEAEARKEAQAIDERLALVETETAMAEVCP